MSVAKTKRIRLRLRAVTVFLLPMLVQSALDRHQYVWAGVWAAAAALAIYDYVALARETA